MPARVAGAIEAVACERATIESGTSARELMQRAGYAAAAEIAERLPERIVHGAAILTGPGNNGGDGWVVARALADRGFRVTAFQVAPPKTADAMAARQAAAASAAVVIAEHSEAAWDGNGVIIDALLGTGSTGPLAGAIAAGVRTINDARANGLTVVSLDLPTGIDATTGSHGECVCADITLAFGTAKRGHLVARHFCGEVVVVDIGLARAGCITSLPLLVDRDWVAARVPAISAMAHKGTRRQVAIVGGGQRMAGAAILAGEAALRSGIGLLRIVVAPGNATSIHAALPAAIVHEWPETPDDIRILTDAADAIAIGPGLGRSNTTRDLVERLLLAWRGPVVLDADALNVFEEDLTSLGTLLRGRPALITPHPAEAARLLGVSTSAILDHRFDVGLELAREIGATVLLKGTPTVISSPSGERFVSASGTAALATGGSGDVLTGIAVTLLAQMTEGDLAAIAAACAAFVHGRAAEICGMVRGTTLDDVLRSLPYAWNEKRVAANPGVLAVIPRVA